MCNQIADNKMVEVVSTQLVQARSCKKQRIELGPSDLMAFSVPPIHRGLVFLKPQQNGSTITRNTYVEHLKKSLSCILDSFSVLAGRLVMVEHDNDHDDGKKMVSFFIDSSNQGAQFVHATASHVTVADILEPVFVPPILHSFLPLSETRNYSTGISDPLLAIQVTELVDGVFIGCYMNHFVADGTSFWNFINSWSEISRQDRIINFKPPPVFDRSLFGTICNIHFPIRVPFPLPPPPRPVTRLDSKIFHFSKTKIAELKARTNDNKISSLQSLLAHVWRFMLQTRGANPADEDESSLMLPLGTRSRLEVPLGDEYFGNAVDCELVTSTVKQILAAAAALQINRVVASHTPDKVRRKLESWVQNPSTAGFRIPPNAFLVVSSPRFDVYGNDFGWGTPVAARSNPYNLADGVLILLPGKEEGSIEIEICSSHQSLKILGNDPHFT